MQVFCGAPSRVTPSIVFLALTQFSVKSEARMIHPHAAGATTLFDDASTVRPAGVATSDTSAPILSAHYTHIFVYVLTLLLPRRIKKRATDWEPKQGHRFVRSTLLALKYRTCARRTLLRPLESFARSYGGHPNALVDGLISVQTPAHVSCM